jgi:hypothetical protein
VNLVLQSGLPIANRRIPELDYCVSVTPTYWTFPPTIISVAHNL